MTLESSLTFNASLYLSLSPTEKRIVIYLRSITRAKKPVFPSRKRISQHARCSIEAVRKFFKKNRDICNLIFEKEFRFDANSGRQTSNLYRLSSNLLNAIDWIDIYFGLKPSKKKYQAIISSIEKQENVPPPLSTSYPPIIKNLLNQEIRYVKRPAFQKPMNPMLAKVGISDHDKIILNRYSDSVITRAIEDAIRYTHTKKEKIRNPAAFLTNRINHYSRGKK